MLAEKGGRPVRRPLLVQATILIAAGTLLVSSGCCVRFPGYGTIIRGNWSLECNRVPWLGASPQACGETTCGPGPVIEGGVPLSCAAPRGCRPGVSACRTCGHPASAANAPPQQMGHSRFHPVPTRPVFTPWICPPTGRVSQVPQRTVRQPRYVEPEVIPTPAATDSTQQPTLAAPRVTNAAWIFRPEDTSGATLAAR